MIADPWHSIEKMVVDSEEDVKTLKDKVSELTRDRERSKTLYGVIHNKHEDLKAEKKKIEESIQFTTTNNIRLRAQIEKLHSSEKDKELDEAKRYVEQLKSKLQEANDRERTFTSQLLERGNLKNPRGLRMS